ncbi:retinol dehydrogenase 12 [Andrena cerasifolii]|uniref:retinol dehydrogenase 12 n=1 Tax=Andrena cerasifolii TaxID=2819439 RepID=UPI0040380C7C
MLFIGSICALIAGAIMYRLARRESWPFVVEQILCEVKYTVVAVTDLIFDWVHAKNNKNEYSSQAGRIAIITGGSRGIAVEVVKMLLEHDMEVIIACRRPAAGEKTILQIRESGISTGKVKVYKMDNASLESVKRFAAEIKRDYKEIHVLINNAGVMFCPYEETVDGFEQQWGVNYLSHFLLTALLLPLLKAGGLPQQCSRVVNISSCAHLLGKINFADINHNKQKNFLSGYAYAQSKLALEVFTKKLQNLLKEHKYNVQTYSVHPGIILTELFMHSYLWRFKSIIKFFLKAPKDGATSIVYAAINKAIENSGGAYITNCRPTSVNPDVLDPSIQDQLLELSLQQAQLKDFFQFTQ